MTDLENDDTPVNLTASETCKVVLMLCLSPKDEGDFSTPEQDAINLANINAALDFAEKHGFTKRKLLTEQLAMGWNANISLLKDLMNDLLDSVDPVAFLAAAGFFSASLNRPYSTCVH